MAKKLPNEKIMHRVEDRLIALKSLKDKYNLSNRAREWKNKANMVEVITPDENDFRTQVSSTVKRQKDAELSANMPEYSFIPRDDNAEANRKIVRESWKYHWLESNTDKTINQIISQATTYWTWIMYDWIKHTLKTIKEPYLKEWIIEFRDKEIKCSEIYCERIPFNNFYINWIDIDESTEACVITYYDLDDYVAEKKDSPIYKNISKLKNSQTDYVLSWFTDWEDINPASDINQTITEIKYYNSARDEYIIIANWFEILNSHIPYMHKKLPFIPYYDNMAEDRFWGIWEFELLEPEERAKNEYRTLTIKWVKASMWFILKDRNSDLEVQDLEFGVQEVYETDDLDWVMHFHPNVPIWDISNLEAKIDNDIISKSWIDFKALQLSSWESATRTANKSLSSKKRINKNIKDNSYNFFRRLWEIRLANIQQLHMMKPKRISIEWGSIDNKWIYIKDETWAYGSWIIWEKFIKWDFRVIPITETMIWDNKQRRKENLNNFMQVTWNLVWEDWKPVIKPKQLAKLAADEYNYDYEKLTEESEDSQSPDDIVNEVFNEWGMSPEDDPRNPNYIPPSQRSWAKQQVNAISWQAKIRDEDLAAEM